MSISRDIRMPRRWFTRMITALPFALRARSVLSASSPDGFKIPPGFTVKWDVGRDDSEISATFSVTEYRYYDIQILFQSTPGTTQQLFEFTGDGATHLVTKESADSDRPEVIAANSPEERATRTQGIAAGQYVWRPTHSGVMIPVHLRIEKTSGVAGPEVEVDQDFNTWNITGSFPGFSRSSPGGLARQITSVKLRPGSYTLTAKSLSRISLPAGHDVYLLAAYHVNTRSLRNDE